MIINWYKRLILIYLLINFASCDEYEDRIKFELYNGGPMQITTFNKSLADQGCNMNGSFSFMTHGWQGSNTLWIPDMISNLSFYRPGCVIFMNYSYFSDRDNYFEVISHFRKIASLVTRKLNQITDAGGSSDKISMFGFSFGGRIVIEAGLNYGLKMIGQIDSKQFNISTKVLQVYFIYSACDMAGPGFDFIYDRDPKDAAKNVQCIHTSFTAGTLERKCHQNWLMGHCGEYQDAGNDAQVVFCALFKNCVKPPMLSHSTCPYFYNSAFRNAFKYNTNSKCVTKRPVTNLPVNFMMGMMETRKK